MKKNKKILLQCLNLTNFYNGLSAIYTKYPDRNVDIDVLVSCKAEKAEAFVSKIRLSKYIRNIYTMEFKKPEIYKKLSKLKENFFNKILFNLVYKKALINDTKKQIPFKENYSDFFYSQEHFSLLFTSLKFIYPKADFNTYGDGVGIIFGTNTKICFWDKKDINYSFVKEIIPTKITGLIPYKMDNSMNTENVPVTGASNEIWTDLVKNDTEIQNQILPFEKKIIENYRGKEKSILLLSNIVNGCCLMDEETRLNLYAEIINKYCSDDSLLILKHHPGYRNEISDKLWEKIDKKIEVVEIPEEIGEYPIEIFYNLLYETKNIITFISVSYMSIKYLYGLNCIDGWEIIQKYPLIYNRLGSWLKAYHTIAEHLDHWDKKSLLYEYDAVPEIEKFYTMYSPKH